MNIRCLRIFKCYVYIAVIVCQDRDIASHFCQYFYSVVKPKIIVICNNKIVNLDDDYDVNLNNSRH